MDLKRISAWSISNPVPTTILFLILSIVGLFSFFSLGIDESPNIDLPVVSVTVTESGAAPSELETEVTRKVEDAVAGIGNIKHITSTINEGISTTTIEFELGTNTDRSVNDVRNEVSKIRQQLPQGIDEPVVQRVEFTGSAFVTYTVSSEKRSHRRTELADRQFDFSLVAGSGWRRAGAKIGRRRSRNQYQFRPHEVECAGRFSRYGQRSGENSEHEFARWTLRTGSQRAVHSHTWKCQDSR